MADVWQGRADGLRGMDMTGGGMDELEGKRIAAQAQAAAELLRQALAGAAMAQTREAADEAESAPLAGRPFQDTFDVHPKESVELATDGLIHLVGDEAAPGDTEYYGTNGAGAKGFHPLPTGSDVVAVKESLEYDNAPGADGKLHLVGDDAAPGASHYYGTDDADPPVKGFHPLPTGADVVAVKESVEYATADGALHLVGDEAAPGNSEYYGTNGSGTKGFHALPDPMDGVVPKESVEYDTDDELHLVGDAAAPGATKYYGTNSGSAKGWHDLEDVVDAVMLALGATMTSPDYVLGKKTVSGVTTYGWVATTSHADEHPEST